MDSILIVDEGYIDRMVVSDILAAGLREVDIRVACNAEQAAEMLKARKADMLIVDIPYPSMPAEELVQAALKTQADLSVLLTGVLKESEMNSLSLHLGAHGYLAKPFRPAQLLAEAMQLLQSALVTAAQKEEERQDEYIQKLDGAIQECNYKKCVELAKEYLDSLYDTMDNGAVIRTRTVEFAEKLVRLDEKMNKESSWRLSGCLARFRTRSDLQGTRYFGLSILEEMLDIIFEEMGQGGLYTENTLQRVLNFIDRNIKRGVTLDEAAEYVNMSSCYFSKYFKKETGVNFITYVTGRKIDYAKEMLLHTDMPVINIAYELSYNETGYFSKAFKKKVGITPTEFREGLPAVNGLVAETLIGGEALAAER